MAELELMISPPAVTPPAEAKVEELLEELRELGHEPRVVLEFEQRDALQPLEIVIRLAEDLGEAAVKAIVLVAVGWIGRVVKDRHGRRRDTVRIYGPNGDVIREVEVDVEPESEVDD